MEKRDFKELAVMRLENGESLVPINTLQRVMKETGACRVYMIVPKDGLFVGLVSAQDILGTTGRYVAIKKDYTVIKGDNFLKAKKMIIEKGLGFLPVVNDNGLLMGEFDNEDEYSFIADKIMNFYDPRKDAIRNTCQFFTWNGRVAVLVRPFKEKNIALYNRMVELFADSEVPFQVADENNIKDFTNQSVYLIFPDASEYYTMQAVCRDSLYGRAEYISYRSFFDHMDRWQSDHLDYCLLRDLLPDSGDVSVYVISEKAPEDSEYLKNYREQRPSAWFPSDEASKEFFAELYSPEYVQSMKSIPFGHTRIDGVNRLMDSAHPLFHVKNGERTTAGIPEVYDRTIWFFGPCVMVGNLVDDEHTLESYLQERLNKAGYSVRVRNAGAWGGMLGSILSTRFNSGDILVLYDGSGSYGFPGINLSTLAEKYNMPYSWFTDTFVHCNHKAHDVWAKELFELIQPKLEEQPKNRNPFQFSKQLYLRNVYINKYFHNAMLFKYEKIGSIVMNCNPFTKGHRYLIEESLKRVDYLIIFVVEEDKSLFSFTERYHMVKAGTQDLENVKVVPGGAFILSQTTFPEYFIKIKDEDIVVNVEYDVSLFAEFIAKPLGITYRFVGEEIEDAVTAEYNAAMKRILPQYDIRLIEIPRIKNSENFISASRVRKSIESGEFLIAKDMLPESSQRFLFMNPVSSDSGKYFTQANETYGNSYLIPFFKILSMCMPESILEFNFDDITKYMGRYMEKSQGSHMVIDFDRQRAEYQCSEQDLSWDRTNLHISPLLESSCGELSGVTYQQFDQITENKEFDFVLLKSPFGERCMQMDILSKLPKILCDDFAILVNHLETEFGEVFFQYVIDSLVKSDINFYRQNYSDESGCTVGVLISERWKFALG